jgi:hypothetical protein
MNSFSSKSSMQNPDAKKPALPSYQEYSDAIAFVKKSNTPTPFSNFEEVGELMKHLKIIKVCERAEREKIKAANEKAKLRMQIAREAEQNAIPIKMKKPTK